MKIAVIGQSLFGQEVYCHLRKEGHEVVGVFTVPDKDGKADPLGKWVAQEQGKGLLRQAVGRSRNLVVVMGIPGWRQPYVVHLESCSGANQLPDFSETK